MNFKEIQKIVELMNEHDLSQFTLEQGDTKLELKKGGNMDIQAVERLLASSGSSGTMHSAPAHPVTPPPPTDQAGSPSSLPAGVEEITSPMVGTLYSSPDPESEPFVKVGSKISPDSVLCIVEAMKVMNEIKSEISGEIIEILVENGTPVQFGDPLFRVKCS